MTQVSAKLRRASNGFIHHCPGCDDSHLLPVGWQFNGNVDCPTFSPSFLHQGVQTKRLPDGGFEFLRDAAGNPIPDCCHYILTDGILNFCSDSVHALAGQSVPLPDLPDYLKDEVTP